MGAIRFTSGGYSTPNSRVIDYTAGIGTIGFSNVAADSWKIDFNAAPDSFQSFSGATLVSYDYSIKFWQLENSTDIEIGNSAVNYSKITTGNGAGTYEIAQTYIFSNGTKFLIQSIYVVDATTNIIAYEILKGNVVNSVTGLVINTTTTILQSNTTYPIQWFLFNGSVYQLPFTGDTNNVTTQLGDNKLGNGVKLDSFFTDISGSLFSYFDIIIS